MKETNIPRLQQLHQFASDFVASQSNRTSLITVTRAELSNTNNEITFYVSVFPEDMEGPAVGFLMRKRGECKAYIKKHSSMKYVPHVEFALDDGEKSRRRVDELLSE